MDVIEELKFLGKFCGGGVGWLGGGITGWMGTKNWSFCENSKKNGGGVGGGGSGWM